MKSKNYLKTLIILLIDLYKMCISPFFGQNCKYYPSCSNYTKEAIMKKGITVGTLLAFWRILRCNPFSYGGYDPVDKMEYKKWKKEH